MLISILPLSRGGSVVRIEKGDIKDFNTPPLTRGLYEQNKLISDNNFNTPPLTRGLRLAHTRRGRWKFQYSPSHEGARYGTGLHLLFSSFQYSPSHEGAPLYPPGSTYCLLHFNTPPLTRGLCKISQLYERLHS